MMERGGGHNGMEESIRKRKGGGGGGGIYEGRVLVKKTPERISS